MLEVGVPHLALLFSEVSQDFSTLLHAAELKFIAVAVAGASSIGRAGERNSSSFQQTNGRKTEFLTHLIK